ncbi:MAG TPA: HAD-IA family hydrolase [Trebonia sp.]|jgi:putative hydrolase of the HAD superfamily|nr:HAD-IA family hydrolase [Trebonia sp.]
MPADPAAPPVVRACLIDVYDTILASHFPDRSAILAALAQVPAAQWNEQWAAIAYDRDAGRVTVAEAFTRTLTACGRDPQPALVERLVARDAELLAQRTEVCDDTAPTLARLRAAGIRLALVSNCAEGTRPMLAAKGLLGLVDATVLSCEVGTPKPEPEIYHVALDALGAEPADAVFLDDQPGYCAGARAVGVRAIQVVRPGIATRPPDPLFTPVPSLAAVLPILLP